MGSSSITFRSFCCINFPQKWPYRWQLSCVPCFHHSGHGTHLSTGDGLCRCEPWLRSKMENLAGKKPGWWFGTFLYFFIDWELPSQLTNIFQGGWNHQPETREFELENRPNWWIFPAMIQAWKAVDLSFWINKDKDWDPVYDSYGLWLDQLGLVVSYIWAMKQLKTDGAPPYVDRT